MNYQPQPIDTRQIELPPEISELTERLAENAHDQWARQRLQDGWRYGPTRNDAGKEHPCLVPYEALPESEKTYDRTIVLETLRVLVALGYTLQPPGRDEPARGPNSAGADGDAPALLRPPGRASLCATTDVQAPADDTYQQIGERALQQGKPLLAYDILEEALKLHPRSPRLRQLQALALLRGGATERANAVLAALDRESDADEETLGLLGRTYKDLGLRAADSAVRIAELGRAHDAYTRAYRLTGGHWSGINAATLAFVIGRRETAIELAREVRERCLTKLRGEEQDCKDQYWLLATLGEAALILAEWSEAEDWYGRAAEVGRDRLGDLASTRRNARLLLEHMDAGASRIERSLRLPRVVVFTGHMIDAADRRPPRFPPALENTVRGVIRERIEKLDARLGFTAGACGGDILFLETILDLGGEANLVLPYGREQFVKDSVDVRPGGWTQRFDRLVERAVQIVVASPQKLEDKRVSYHYASLMLLGLASIRAEQLDTELVPLALWDGRQGLPGGTASVVAEWRRWGHEVEVIHLNGVLDGRPPELARSHEVTTPPPPAGQQEGARVMAILFADAVHFSRLTESQVPRFVEHFLGAIAELAQRAPSPPVMKNTWGDGLYFVFEGVGEAGEFALRLSELVNRTDWASKGLPAGLNLRVALHAGPVYCCRDPVTGQLNYIGSHVSRGARIEPITPPGHVYASQAFAALAATRVREFVCEYAGQTVWAKGYGTFPTYHVRRRERGSP